VGEEENIGTAFLLLREGGLYPSLYALIEGGLQNAFLRPSLLPLLTSSANIPHVPDQ